MALLALFSGCATNGDPRDPAEPFNRAMYSFNEAFDEAILKPVATGYREVVPGPVRGFVRNFFANIADLLIGVNNLLQGKPLDALTDWTRFTFNTLFGVFGIVDFASEMGLEKHDEDFGQTFGRWGMPDGPYLVIPFLGSSSVRDGTALILDWGLDPVAVHDPRGVRWFMIGTRAISKRADLLDASRILEEAALDKYVFQRDAYLQRRRNLVYDGNPPRAQREAPPRAEEPEQTPPRAEEPEQAPRVEAVEQPRPGPQGGLQVLEHPAGG